MSFRSVYGYDWSENGWRMCNRNECALPIVDMDYVDTAPIRTGAPLTILSAWLKYYDTHIDPITSSVWGWSAENAVGNSNHLSGTALDINAPKYPWGDRTMPADRKSRVRAALAAFEGTVFWGADWDRADEMHFQLAYEEGDERNERFAAKLRAGYLGIYGTDTTGGDEDMPSAEDIAKAVWAAKVAKPDGTSEQAGILIGWTDQHAGDSLDQVAGSGTKHQRGGPLAPTGWPQLGKNPDGTPRSLVDAVAFLVARAEAEDKA